MVINHNAVNASLTKLISKAGFTTHQQEEMDGVGQKTF